MDQLFRTEEAFSTKKYKELHPLGRSFHRKIFFSLNFIAVYYVLCDQHEQQSKKLNVS